MPLITGQDDAVSTADHIVHWDAEWHYDPEGVTFERKAIGGHLILLGLKQGGQPFAQYTDPIFEWAKERGAIGGFAHMQYLPFAFYPPPDGIPLSLDCCAPLEYPVEVALGSASFLMEDVHGSDSALQAYYRILNCGFRPGLVTSTDYSCNYLEPLGTLLTYCANSGRQADLRQVDRRDHQGPNCRVAKCPQRISGLEGRRYVATRR
jgi:hypothetical protein